MTENTIQGDIPMKYTLITGGTSGIGYELAKLFAKNGHNLIIVARDEADLSVACHHLSEYNVKVITISKDLSIPESAQQLFKEIKKRKDVEVDILVNNAGQGHYGEFRDTDLMKELSIIQLNIATVVTLTKLFLKDMLAAGSGKILNVSSIASKAPGPFHSVYHGTKAFVQSFTEAIRDELKETGITVTALLPGATDTDFFNKADMMESKIVQSGKLADAAKVAEDGYEALMRGDDMVISGFKNKVQVAMSKVMPDSKNAATMHKQQEPVGRNSK